MSEHQRPGPGVSDADRLSTQYTTQDSNTRHLIFDCYYLVEHLSTAFTLEPGDVISTGTPGGVAGVMKPPKWLVPGDKIRVEIEGLDSIENTVIQEPAETTLI